MTTASTEKAYSVEYFYARPGCSDELKSALGQLAVLSRKEMGCLQYELLQDKENSNLLIIFMIYQNNALIEQHVAMDYIQAFVKHDMDRLCEKVLWNDALAIG